MKRSIKNIIMTGMAIVMIGTSAITCSYAGMQSRCNTAPPAFSQQENGKQQFKPSQGGMQNGNGSNNQQPPEMNGKSGDSNSQQPPEMNGNNSDSNSQQPPEMNGNSGDSKDSQSDSKSSNTALETPAETTQTSLDTTEAKAAPVMKNNSNALAALCYIFLAVQISILLMIIAYLIVSKCNKLSFNQVFSNNKKVSD